MTGVAARSFLSAGTAAISLTAMLRVLIIFAIFFGVLASAAHVEAHASGQHGHDAVEAGHHAHDDDGDGPVTDDGRPAKADHMADHAAGHSHVVGDRSSTLDIDPRAYASRDARYRTPPDLTLPSAPCAPLLEPPSA